MRYKAIIFSALVLLLCTEVSMAHCCPGPGCPTFVYGENMPLSELLVQPKYFNAITDMLLDTTYTHGTCESVFSALNAAPRSTYNDLSASNIKRLQFMWKSLHKSHPGIGNNKAFIAIGKQAMAKKEYHLARFCFIFAAYSSRAGQLLATVNGKITSTTIK